MIGFSTAQSVEADVVGVEIDLTSDEAVGPERIDREGAAEQVDLTMVIGSSEKDDSAGWMSLKALLPRMREGLPEGSGQDALGGAGACGGNELGGLILKGPKRAMVEALPDLRLPSAVVAFDGGLEARFTRWSEDRSHLQREAQAGNTAEIIGVLVGSLEAGVVIELGIARQADLTPVVDQYEACQLGRDGGSWPRGRQAAVKGDGVKDLDINSAFNDKAGNDVDAIGLDSASGDVRQVPAAWRRWATDPSLAVQSSPSLQDATDGTNRGDFAMSSLDQFSTDGDITIFSQVACFLELSAKLQDLFFYPLTDPIGWAVARSGRSIRPVHAIQPLFSGAANPAAHRGEAHPKVTSDRPDRHTLADGSDDVTAKPLERIFLNPYLLLSARRGNHIRSIRPIPALALARPMEADEMWEAAEYGTFPHPLENAPRFPQLPQAATPTTCIEKYRKARRPHQPESLTVG